MLVIDALVDAHRKSTNLPTQFDTLFEILMRNHPSKADVNLKIIKDFKDTHKMVEKAQFDQGNPNRLLSKLHLPAKIAVFTIFISKFFGHMYTYALKIFR